MSDGKFRLVPNRNLVNGLERAEDDALQVVPDELDMVESLDLDMDPTDEEMPISQDIEMIVLDNNLEQSVEDPKRSGVMEKDEESGQFFEQPGLVVPQHGMSSKSTSLFSNRKLLMALVGLSLVVLLSIAFILGII